MTEEQTVTLQMQGDFAGKLAASRPIQAIVELIWNGLDAEAKHVKVTGEMGELGLRSITVQDDGHGMSRKEALRCFENLGGSWKKINNMSKSGLRHLHGKEGRGRLRALAIGRVAEWTVTGSDEQGKLENFTVTIIRDDLRRARFSSTSEIDPKARPGTRVTITELDKNWELDTASAYQEVAESFALYMTEYREISIVFGGKSVNPSTAIRQRGTYTLPQIETDDELFQASLEIVEWKRQTDRMLYLCDKDGLPLQRVPPMIHAPGFEFSAYHKSNYNSRLNQRGALDLAELDPALLKSLEQSKDVLRKHFKSRQAEDTRSLVERWKTEAVYPYKEEPGSLIETAERQLFDILALNVSSALQNFEDQDSKNKRFQLRMLRQAIEKSPAEVQLIMTEVLGLSRQKQDELAKLLRKTTLSSIIAAGKMVAERLDFLTGLEAMLFDPDLKKGFRERKQLHKLLAENTWIFGEEFNLTVSDRSLSEVVKKHLVSIGAKADVDTNLKRLDGRAGIIDLFLTRRIPTSRAEEREYLIVELKAPKVSIGPKETAQLRSYAYPIQDDERFRNMKIRWEFWVVSNDMTSAVVKEVTSSDRPFGMLDRKDNCRLWVKTWAEILSESRARLQLFEKELNYNVDKDGGLTYLRSTYARILNADTEPFEEDDTDETDGDLDPTLVSGF
jgi:Histidine kinase-, DNA gyrase B-, and HSP90-like ATPase